MSANIEGASEFIFGLMGQGPILGDFVQNSQLGASLTDDWSCVLYTDFI